MSARMLVAAVAGAARVDRPAAEWVRSESGGGAGIVVEIGRERPRPATLLAPREAKQMETTLAAAVPEATVKARGGVLWISIDDSDELADRVEELRSLAGERPIAVLASAPRYRELLELEWDRVLICADRSADRAGGADDPGDPGGAGGRGDGPGRGSDPLVELILEEAGEFADRVELGPGPGRRPRLLSRLASGSGQATPLVLGGVFALVVGAMAVAAISGAVTGKAKAQSAADLAAMSAARSMKDDLPRLLAPPRLPNGLPNPAHMPKPVYLSRARLAAVEAAVANGASALAVAVRFPDSRSYAPVRARVAIANSVPATPAGGRHRSRPSWAEARVSAPVSMGAVPAVASGGGYSGPLAERQGKGMRPDVAAAFDLMAAAAGAAGVTLAINSAFRSDAEQAALFAANPDPTWVAPPGRSLHRCATELDLGPAGAYGWLAANAGRFGFEQRYGWEPWHFGFTRGPAPCSEAGNAIGLGGARAGGDRSAALSQAFPAVTPNWVKPLILRAAAKWDVSSALLAAQLFAESSFDPDAGNGIAFGIAAFTPAAAAEYGLEDPFDPAAAIMAQAHLMSDLLGRFGSPALALAAYNAGPGAVGSCDCIPGYPETQAYVAKILGMLGGMGAIASIGMEIELAK